MSQLDRRLSALEGAYEQQHNLSPMLQAVGLTLGADDQAALLTARQESFEAAWVLFMEIGQQRAPAAAAAIVGELRRRRQAAGFGRVASARA